MTAASTCGSDARFPRHTRLPFRPHRNRNVFQRYVESNIFFHGCSSLVAWDKPSARNTFFHLVREQPPWLRDAFSSQQGTSPAIAPMQWADASENVAILVAVPPNDDVETGCGWSVIHMYRVLHGLSPLHPYALCTGPQTIEHMGSVISTKFSGLIRYRPQAIAEPAAPPNVAPPPTAQSWPVPDPIAAPATPPTTAPPTVPATQLGVAAVVEYIFADWHPANAKHDAAIITMLEQLDISSSYRCFQRLIGLGLSTKHRRR